MKVTIELPDTTKGAFVSYVYGTNNIMSMAVRPISTDDLHNCEVIVCESDHSTEKGDEE